LMSCHLQPSHPTLAIASARNHSFYCRSSVSCPRLPASHSTPAPHSFHAAVFVVSLAFCRGFLLPCLPSHMWLSEVTNHAPFLCDPNEMSFSLDALQQTILSLSDQPPQAHGNCHLQELQRSASHCWGTSVSVSRTPREANVVNCTSLPATLTCDFGVKLALHMHFSSLLAEFKPILQGTLWFLFLRRHGGCFLKR
jgi:hypothetical protein